MHAIKHKGFILLEAMVSCALVMLTWYAITLCAVQAIALKVQVENKGKALIAASTCIEKLRAGVYPLKNQTIIENGFKVIVACEQKFYGDYLKVFTVKLIQDESEYISLKTAVLEN